MFVMHINGLVQERRKSIVNALELCLSCINPSIYGSGHGTVAVLLPGFAINWLQNQVTRQPQFRDLTHMPNQTKKGLTLWGLMISCGANTIDLRKL